MAGPTRTASSSWTFAHLGSAVLSAYKVTGNPRYLAAATRWADLLAQHCDLRPGAVPWTRHAVLADAPKGWSQQATGGVSLILRFLNEVIALGHRGEGDSLVKARDAGEKYLRDVLLPAWSANPPLAGTSGTGTTRSTLVRCPALWPNTSWTAAMSSRSGRRTSAISCRCSSAAPASIPLRRAACTRGVGRSGVQRLLRPIAASLDHAGCALGPLRGAGRRRLGPRDRPPRDDPHHLRRPRNRRGGRPHQRRRQCRLGMVQFGPSLPVADGHGDARLAAGIVRPGGRTTSCAPPPWCPASSTARAGSPTAPTTAWRPARTCCGWHLRPPRSRPTASPCRGLRSCRKTATRSSPWPTAIFS